MKSYGIGILVLALLVIYGCAQPEVGQEADQIIQDEKVNESEELVVDTEAPVKKTGSVKEIAITAKRFDFTPSTVTVKQGENVRLKITSTDVTHGFELNTPFVNVNKDLSPGEEVIVEFTATEKGSWDFKCSVFCGSGHSGMKGKLVVE